MSEDLDEMLYYWKYWRDLSGDVVDKPSYARYVTLANEAAGSGMYQDVCNNCNYIPPTTHVFTFLWGT